MKKMSRDISPITWNEFSYFISCIPTVSTVSNFAVLRCTITMNIVSPHNLGQTKESFISIVAVAALAIVSLLVVFSVVIIRSLSQLQSHTRTRRLIYATFSFGQKYEDHIYVLAIWHAKLCQQHMFHLTHHQLSFSYLIASSPNLSPSM